MSYDYLFKLIVIGEPGVGKTALIEQLTKKSFPITYQATIGLDFATKIIMVKDHILIKSHIWDTAGQESFSSIIASYYREVAGAIIVFDLADYKSFQRCEFWLAELNSKKQSDKNISVILIGNKVDKKDRQVSKVEAMKYAEDHKMLYMETSAKTKKNVECFYTDLIMHIFNNMDQNGENIGIKKGFCSELYDISYNKIRDCTTFKYDCCKLS